MAINPTTGMEDPNYVDPNATTGGYGIGGTTPIPMTSTVPDVTAQTPAVDNTAVNTAATSNTPLVSPATAQAVGVGGSLASGALTANAIKDAASQLQSGLKTAEGTIANYAQPYTTTGAAANQQLATGLQAGGQFNKPFSMADATNSDAEKYARTVGIDALQNSALAKGGLLGTNALVGIEDFAAKNAAQYQNQAFNQNLQQNQLAMGGLENLSGTGATTANAAGSNIAGLETQAAEAGMNATLGAANQYNQAVQNAISAYKALAPTATTTAPATQQPAAKISTTPAGVPSGVSTNGTPAPAVTPNGTPAGNVTDANQTAAETARLAAQNGGNVQDANQTAAETARLNAANAAIAPAVAPAQAQQAAQAAQQAVAQGTATPQQAAQVASNAAQAIAQSFGQTPQEAAALAQTNAANAQAAGVQMTGQVGTGVGDISPSSGGVILPDPITGIPIDSVAGFPTMGADTFDNFFLDLLSPAADPMGGLDPSIFDQAITDPALEFASLAFDPNTAFDTTTGPDLSNMSFDPAAFDPASLSLPAFDPAAFDMPAIDLSSLDFAPTYDYSTPTFDMGSYDTTTYA